MCTLSYIRDAEDSLDAQSGFDAYQRDSEPQELSNNQ